MSSLAQQYLLTRARHIVATVVLAVTATTLVVPSTALAIPGGGGLDNLQTRAAAVRTEIARLDRQASASVERYNQARATLDASSARLILARRSLARTEAQLASAQTNLNEHIAGMYKYDQPGLLDMLLSLDDFVEVDKQLEYLQLVHDADADTVVAYEALARQQQEQAQTAEAERISALHDEMEVRARRDEIERKLASRSALLKQLDGNIKNLLARQAEREAEAAQALARQTGVDLEGLAATPAQRAVVVETMKHLGIPYVWGGASPSQGFDCSGLVMYVFHKFGVDVLHGATLQSRGGTPVPLGKLQPADLVFFGTTAFYHHVGIHIGNGLFIEAPHTGDVVKISKLAGRGCTFACRYPLRLR